ncbi:hypothetical protein F4805DRAFT_313992 [Annulohypoxylon moriforme]|nr:hypothetical protein F4805DRAFT_313992 [Annulohypoxylon moriforme]
MYFLAIRVAPAWQTISTRARAIIVLLLFPSSSVLACPMPTSTISCTITYLHTPTSSIKLSNSTQHNDTPESQRDTYSLTLVQTIFGVLGGCLALIGITIAIIECKARARHHVEVRGQETTSDEEAGRESRDTPTQQGRSEGMDASTAVLLKTPSGAEGQTHYLPEPMPTASLPHGQDIR